MLVNSELNVINVKSIIGYVNMAVNKAFIGIHSLKLNRWSVSQNPEEPNRGTSEKQLNLLDL